MNDTAPSNTDRSRTTTARVLRTWRAMAMLAGWIGSLPLVPADVPAFLSHEGRILADGVPFNGSGKFKFSLVDATGTSTIWSHDGSAMGGAMPASFVALPVVKGNFHVRLGDPTVPGMTQAIVPGVFAIDGIALRIWFDDGIHGFQRLDPDYKVASVGYAMIAATVADGSVTAAKLAPGAVGATELAPGAAAANLAAGGLSGVPVGATVISEQDDDPALLGAGYERVGTIDLGETWESHSTPATAASPPEGRAEHTAVWAGTHMVIWGGANWDHYPETGGAFDPMQEQWSGYVQGTQIDGFPEFLEPRSSHSAVWTGTEIIVWGGRHAGTALATGSRTTFPQRIVDLPVSPSPLGARFDHTTVWTGDRMIVFGGTDADFQSFGDGASYDPVSDTWTSLPSLDAPGPRRGHSAVWTGSEMIVWGGKRQDGTEWNDGARYSPSQNRWTRMSSVGSPQGRDSHTAVWTGVEMLVWGGWNGFTVVGTGARYRPATDTWVPLPEGGGSRSSHTAVWTGSEMIVWGGSDGSVASASGARYSPASDAWSPTSLFPDFAGRYGHTAIWTGEELLIWGGRGGNPLPVWHDGARYRPDSDSWKPIQAIGTPAARRGHSTVWTGAEMLVWGGERRDLGRLAGDGFRYDPLGRSWKPISPVGAPSARTRHATIWTGSRLIVWGGLNSRGWSVDDGGEYDPASDRWTLIQSGPQSPSPRFDPTAVWTGAEMIVWGGRNFLSTDDIEGGWPSGAGGIYSPASGWRRHSEGPDHPEARWGHTSVWTGSEMLIWGGRSTLQRYEMRRDGSRYDPVSDRWQPIYDFDSPSPRSEHTSLWTGREWIIWGGLVTGPSTFGATFTPGPMRWRQISPLGEKVLTGHAAIWTGQDMIVWGGSSIDPPTDRGGRFDPSTGLWRAVTTVGAPHARENFSAVWAGDRMIVWGNGSLGFDPDVPDDMGLRVYHYFPTRHRYLYKRR